MLTSIKNLPILIASDSSYLENGKEKYMHKTAGAIEPKENFLKTMAKHYLWNWIKLQADPERDALVLTFDCIEEDDKGIIIGVDTLSYFFEKKTRKLSAFYKDLKGDVNHVVVAQNTYNHIVSAIESYALETLAYNMNAGKPKKKQKTA